MGKKILVVEDDEVLRGFISTFVDVKKPGWQLVEAEDGRQALAKLESFTPDLILCDRLMPEMDGLEFLKLVRSNPRHKGVKFIFLSALTETADIQEAKAAGADDYLTKPIWHDNLIKVIDRHLP